MNKPKHTPGPWKFIPEVQEIRTAHPDKTSQYGNGTPIVGVFDLDTNYEVQFANARLIAAAPEMLRALQLVISDNRLMNALPVEQRRAIMDAINKATSGDHD